MDNGVYGLKYSKNIIAALRKKPLRYSELENILNINSKTLSYTLKRLCNEGVLERRLKIDYPPLEIYYKLIKDIK